MAPRVHGGVGRGPRVWRDNVANADRMGADRRRGPADSRRRRTASSTSLAPDVALAGQPAMGMVAEEVRVSAAAMMRERAHKASPLSCRARNKRRGELCPHLMKSGGERFTKPFASYETRV